MDEEIAGSSLVGPIDIKINALAAPLQSRLPIQQRAVPALAWGTRHYLQHAAVTMSGTNRQMESFFYTLKTERTARKTYHRRYEAKVDVSA